jgi:hypothetical protein
MAKSPLTDGIDQAAAPTSTIKNGKTVKELLAVRAKQLKEITGPVLPDDEAFRKGFPSLWEVLTPQRITAGGKKWDRKAPALSIQMDNGGWRIVVRDNDLQMSMSVYALTFDALVPALELAVNDPRGWVTFRTRGRGLKEARD